MKTILAAIDFTSGTPEVICTAARLAICTHSRLSILHVSDANRLGHDDQKIERALERSDLRTSFPTAEAEELALNADNVCLVGDPARNILKVAKQIGADLIVLGSNDHEELPEGCDLRRCNGFWRKAHARLWLFH